MINSYLFIQENDPSQLKKRHLDFLDIVITARDEHGVGMTDKEMQDECGTIVFAGACRLLSQSVISNGYFSTTFFSRKLLSYRPIK